MFSTGAAGRAGAAGAAGRGATGAGGAAATAVAAAGILYVAPMITLSGLATKDGLALTIASRLALFAEPITFWAILDRLSPGCTVYCFMPLASGAAGRGLTFAGLLGA